jgi:acetyl-CoA carboxylase biotin carboxylase subunit
MRRALDEYFIGGVKTNLPLFRRILEHPDFAAGRIDTGFLDRLLTEALVAETPINELAEIAAISAALFTATTAPQKNGRSGKSGLENAGSRSTWKQTARVEGNRDR